MSFKYTPSELEQEAYQAVQSLLDHWGTTYFSKDASSAPADKTTTSTPVKLPPLEWKYYARHKGTRDREEEPREVQFLTIWSQPAMREPVPRATAGVWMTYRKRDEQVNHDF